MSPWGGVASGTAVRPLARKHSLCANGKPVVVGEDVAISAPFATLGNDDVEGTTAFFDHVNSTRGIDGCHFQIVEENNESTPSLAAALVQKLVS